jgi:hypothetical protein
MVLLIPHFLVSQYTDIVRIRDQSCLLTIEIVHKLERKNCRTKALFSQTAPPLLQWLIDPQDDRPQ